MEAAPPGFCSSSSVHAKAKIDALPATVQRKDYLAVFTTNVNACVKTASRHFRI
jgi:hypothetical protein